MMNRNNSALTCVPVSRSARYLQGLLVWTPGQRDIIKTLALLLMVADHLNRILHLHHEWMYLAGRGAFPLFALVWGLNLSRHYTLQQAGITRLWGWACVAQAGYFLAGFPWYEGNILFAFAVTAQVLKWGENQSLLNYAGMLALILAWVPLSGSSYGVPGLILLALCFQLYRTTALTERLCLVLCLLPVVLILNLADSLWGGMAGVLVTLTAVFSVPWLARGIPRFWPADFFPVFYAGHLVVLGVLAR
ncbi:type-F conjugative transfer system pilin acetylase TraX [Salmonella enterica]|nr:type-F conjugative transfer system pilin acetylase TraX [Salmonella enterica]EDX5729921.1 type-F conjugative transfer system pilin acetylase TraX [Salmonella enterica subsp. enterica serovar Sandiego]EEB2924084.1 type-F conjugative transfer system pilin acetylase TraX [Salmonella enterica]EEM3688025.1 type-F conjugative transfer system pilin acetylase TraX [Salmonella enterica]EIQ4400115.1 type-F conjugative transfer system pilin acetylase TraX [Salmonella enterica]